MSKWKCIRCEHIVCKYECNEDAISPDVCPLSDGDVCGIADWEEVFE